MATQSVVSILICTRNRAGALQGTLQSIGGCDVPQDLPTELLVIDNSSVDHTRQVVQAAGLTNMPVRYLLEPRKGKSHALNKGMAESRGSVILFTDDDVRVPLNWIEGMCRPIIEGRYQAMQGAVQCVFDDTLPDWYDLDAIGGFASVAAPVPNSGSWHGDLIGANMAVSRRVPDVIGGFNTLLGPGRCGFFDDSEFTWRMRDAGFRAGFFECPAMHHPLTNRMSRRSLHDEWFRHGLSGRVATWFHADRASDGGPTLFRRVLRNLKLAGKRRLAGLPYRVSQDEMFFWMQLGAVWGRVRGLRKIAISLGEPPEQPPSHLSGVLNAGVVARRAPETELLVKES